MMIELPPDVERRVFMTARTGFPSSRKSVKRAPRASADASQPTY